MNVTPREYVKNSVPEPINPFPMVSDLQQFLTMATMIQQFPLVVLSHADDEYVLKAGLQKLSFEPKEVSNLEELFAQKSGLATLKLSQENIEMVIEAVSSLRHLGTSADQKGFPEGLKLLFIVSESELQKLPIELQERILLTFSPVYRF